MRVRTVVLHAWLAAPLATNSAATEGVSTLSTARSIIWRRHSHCSLLCASVPPESGGAGRAGSTTGQLRSEATFGAQPHVQMAQSPTCTTSASCSLRRRDLSFAATNWSLAAMEEATTSAYLLTSKGRPARVRLFAPIMPYCHHQMRGTRGKKRTKLYCGNLRFAHHFGQRFFVTIKK